MSENQDLAVITEGKHIRLVRRGGWEFVQRRQISGIVGIVAVTSERKLILVEQYRAPMGKNVIELPAGLAGDIVGQEGEDLSVAAQRELLEETGFSVDRMIEVAAGAVSAGITDEIITLFLARSVRRVNAGGGDESENITVHEIPLNEVESWLKAKRSAGYIVDLKVYAGLWFARAS